MASGRCGAAASLIPRSNFYIIVHKNVICWTISPYFAILYVVIHCAPESMPFPGSVDAFHVGHLFT